MDGIERRRYPRFPVHYDVLCENPEAHPPKRIHAIAENASRTGIKIRFSGNLQPGEQLKVEVSKSIGSKPISFYGSVVWEKESPLVYGEHQAGINITKIGWTDTDRLITDLDMQN